MRRLVAGITAGLLVSLVASVAVATETGTYRDQFSKLGYSGNDGNLHWSTNWGEFGESDGHDKGKVRVVADHACPQGDNCLAISGGGLELGDVGAGRGADLAGFDSAKLSFKMSVVVDDLLGITDAVVSVAASNGSGWDTVGTYLLALSDESEETITLDDAYLTHDFKLRFLVTGLLAGDVYIDDVRVEGPLTASSTTSTTSSSTTSSSTTSSSTTSTTSSTTTSTSTTSTTSTSTSTTSPSSDSSRSTDGDGSSTTSTTADGDASTSEDRGVLTPTREPPTDGGIREPAVGVQADFARGMFGDVTGARPEVLGVELEANYTMAVEVIESSWVWILGLALLIATAIVSGLDRRRSTLAE